MLIDQRAVNAKGGHRDAANPARGQFGREALTAVGEALQNSLQRPLVPRGFSAARSLALAVEARATILP